MTLKSPGKNRRRSPTAASVAHAWDKEIRQRVKAVDAGKIAGISYGQIKQEMTSRFGR